MREEGMLKSHWYLATDRSTKLNILSLEDGIQTDLMPPAAKFPQARSYGGNFGELCGISRCEYVNQQRRLRERHFNRDPASAAY
jgi:hypothetical protein